MTLAQILAAITDIITAVFTGTTGTDAEPSWISTVVSTITSNPLILIATVLPFVGLGIGLLRRLFGTKA